MHTFICQTCQYIGQFKESFAFQLANTSCPGCKKTGGWQDYKGEMAPTILAREDEKMKRLRVEQQKLVIERDACQLEFEAAETDRAKIERNYEMKAKVNMEEAVVLMNGLYSATLRLVTAGNKLADVNAKLKKVDDEVSNLGNRDAVHKDSPKAYQSALEVEKNSKKNKLYIGNRQYVSQHAMKTPAKKFRILDVPNWSPGLNVSWIEGGISAKAHFKIKLNQGDQYSNIPNKVLDKFRETPDYSADEFFKLCKAEGNGSLLWYDKDGAERPTWTALEIWCLLRSGYSFTFADSAKDGVGRKIVLTPPQ